eukprot:scaffold16573_cov119-Skeletonema_marinoi.AAC.6
MSLGYRFSDGVIAESLKNSSPFGRQNRLTHHITIPSKWIQSEFFFKVSYAASYLPTVPTWNCIGTKLFLFYTAQAPCASAKLKSEIDLL